MVLADLPQVPELKQFDDWFKSTLSALGVSAGIVSLVGLAFAIQSWWDAAKQVSEGSRWLGGKVRDGGAALMRMRLARAMIALLTALLVPPAQLLALGLCYLGGNYMSMGFGDDARARAALTLLRQDPWVVLRPAEAAQVLTLDWWSGGCVVLAAVALIRSYKLAAEGRDEQLFSAGALMAGPIALVLLVAVCGLILCGLLLLLILVLSLVSGASATAFMHENLPVVVPLLIGTGICLAYFLACQAAVRGSRLVVRAWTSPPRRPEPAAYESW